MGLIMSDRVLPSLKVSEVFKCDPLPVETEFRISWKFMEFHETQVEIFHEIFHESS
jgi:hypothetical protein